MHTPQQIMMKDFAGILYSVMFQANRLHSIRQVRHASHLHVTLRIFLFHFLFHQDQVGPFITVKQIGKRFVNKPMIRIGKHFRAQQPDHLKNRHLVQKQRTEQSSFNYILFHTHSNFLTGRYGVRSHDLSSTRPPLFAKLSHPAQPFF